MKILLLTMVIASLVMASFTGLNAKTIYYVKVNGTGDGTSWANAAGNIQNMIDKAIAGDEVWVATGIYYPTKPVNASNVDVRAKTFQMKNGVNLYGGFAGNETSINSRAKSDKDGNGTVEAWEFANETILSGDIDGKEDVWTKKVATEGGQQTWYWTVTGNEGNCYHVVVGVGMTGNGALLDGFTVTGGYDTILGHGAGIYANGFGIANCIVRNNMVSSHATDANGILRVEGGGIYYTFTSALPNLDRGVKNCLIVNNATQVTGYASNSAGGGIYIIYGSMHNCTVADNSSRGVTSRGGGIFITNISGHRVDGCIVFNNSSSAFNDGTLNANGKSAEAEGGGIYISPGVVSNCCVFNNQISAYSEVGTFAIFGGGVYKDDTPQASAVIYCSTLINNTKENIFSWGDFGLNCIRLNNVSEHIRPTSFIGAAFNAQQEAELKTAEWRLKSRSMYIDAGSLTGLPDWLTGGTDLAGKPRTTNGKICVGAYEYDPSYTNINELQASDVAVFPNPATNNITVSGLQNNETIRLYNLNGQLLLTRKATGEKETIAVGHLPAGVYFVKTEMGKTLKLVKK